MSNVAIRTSQISTLQTQQAHTIIRVITALTYNQSVLSMCPDNLQFKKLLKKY